MPTFRFPPLISAIFVTMVWALATLVVPPAGAESSRPTLDGELGRVFDTTKSFPLPNQGHLRVHDPNILLHHGYYYLFHGGVHLPIFRATNISGPWTRIGHVFDGESIIHKTNPSRPWAPTAIEHNGTFYCYYALSTGGSRNSAIGVATTDTLDGSPWTDHGAIINTGKGQLSHVYPYRITNAIDPSFITDRETGKSYLNYGSYWHDIWQVPLADDLLSVEDLYKPDAVQLTYMPHRKRKRPEEGSWMSYHDGYYYLWFSHGKCCHFNKTFPPRGDEYSIRVGRSKDVRGPFVDRENKFLLDGGGTDVYASNHGVVYAPGGVGVLPGHALAGNASTPDILYYHYLNTSIGFSHRDAYLGWNFLKYEDGWPVVIERDDAGSVHGPSRWAYWIWLISFSLYFLS